MWLLGYKVVKLSSIFCDNKSMVVTICGTNMMIQKKSIALAFHITREVIATGAVELQHITSDENWADFLIKAVDNCKFILCKGQELVRR